MLPVKGTETSARRPPHARSRAVLQAKPRGAPREFYTASTECGSLTELSLEE